MGPRTESPPERLLDVGEVAAVLADSSRANEIPVEAIPGMLGALEHVKGILWVRLMNSARRNEAPEPDELLTIEEAAQRLRTSEDWLYRHANNLPFAVRLGKGQLRFSSRGITRWVALRQRGS